MTDRLPQLVLCSRTLRFSFDAHIDNDQLCIGNLRYSGAEVARLIRNGWTLHVLEGLYEHVGAA